LILSYILIEHLPKRWGLTAIRMAAAKLAVPSGEAPPSKTPLPRCSPRRRACDSIDLEPPKVSAGESRYYPANPTCAWSTTRHTCDGLIGDKYGLIRCYCIILIPIW
jgi:hypothetical protein